MDSTWEDLSRSDADQAFLAEVKSVLEAVTDGHTTERKRKLSSPKHKGGGVRFSEGFTKVWWVWYGLMIIWCMYFFLPSECPVEKVFGIVTFTASKELKSCTTWNVWNPKNNGINYRYLNWCLPDFSHHQYGSEPSPTGERVEAPDTAYRGALPENPDARHRCEGVHVSVSPQKMMSFSTHGEGIWDEGEGYCTLLHYYIYITYYIQCIYIYM